jgi:hypothetical protein
MQIANWTRKRVFLDFQFSICILQFAIPSTRNSLSLLMLPAKRSFVDRVPKPELGNQCEAGAWEPVTGFGNQ